MKRPSQRDKTKVLPGVRQFVFKHLQNLDKTLDRIERTRACISARKSQFVFNRMIIVDFICGSRGRLLEVIDVEESNDSFSEPADDNN